LPKLPRATGRELARALEKAGFEVERIAGSHAIMDNQATGLTITVPLWRRPLPTGTIHAILRQAGLTGDDLRKLLE
jgi:predicted RNA binding protein YcfA (HicA-like mRNA interferase family)